ncbi:AAA family ATPase [Rhizobium sp. 0TCS1.26]|uniref:ATP-dependent nuclease n=1 Tax=Rhizobium sp. 0TCS1.26 TaxID=3142623 RepID=UPI003D2922E8
MLKEIRLTNFRKYDSYIVRCERGNVLVGPNNSGKSGIIEALRILENCLRYTRKRTPTLVQLPDGNVADGHLVPQSSIDVELTHSSHNYIDAPSVLEFKLTTDAKAIVVIERNEPLKFAVDAGGPRLNSASKFQKKFPLELTIVPTLAPLEREETYVLDETIRKSSSKKTSSRHFRNIWFRKSQLEFDRFAEDVSIAWPGITVQKPERQRGNSAVLEMFYSENRFDREVRWAGFGFQIWLQILTHLSRANAASTVVIDEPDIYLHPDVQKKLLKLLRDRFGQFIMATHSVEIINEADEMEVVSINSKYRNAKRIRSEEDYNNIRLYVGSSTNTDFARVAKTRKVVFVEGEDRKIFQILARSLGLDALAQSVVPFVKLGGFEGWQRALGAVWAFKEILDLEISVFCIFDRDYRCNEEVSAYQTEFEANGLTSRILGRKEIENYFLDLTSLRAALNRRRVGRHKAALEEEDFLRLIDQITTKFKSKVYGQRTAKKADYYKNIRSSHDHATVIEGVHAELEATWCDLQKRLHIVPGKEFLSELNSELQQQGIGQLTLRMISESFDTKSIDPEFYDLLMELDSFVLWTESSLYLEESILVYRTYLSRAAIILMLDASRLDPGPNPGRRHIG